VLRMPRSSSAQKYKRLSNELYEILEVTLLSLLARKIAALIMVFRSLPLVEISMRTLRPGFRIAWKGKGHRPG